MKLLVLVLLLGMAAYGQVKRPTDEISAGDRMVKIVPIRHASFMLEVGEDVVHVDPWSQGNYEGLPKATLILLTHTHGDHLDPALIEKLRTPDTVVVGPPAAEKVSGLKALRNGEMATIEKWMIEAVPMYNIKRGPSAGQPYHGKGQGNGYVVTYAGKRFYISGDTENIPEMGALKDIDVAFVCMNLPYTMTPEEAADAVKAFRPKIVYPYHCRGTNLSAFQKALAGTGIDVRIRDWYY